MAWGCTRTQGLRAGQASGTAGRWHATHRRCLPDVPKRRSPCRLNSGATPAASTPAYRAYLRSPSVRYMTAGSTPQAVTAATRSSTPVSQGRCTEMRSAQAAPQRNSSTPQKASCRARPACLQRCKAREEGGQAMGDRRRRSQSRAVRRSARGGARAFAAAARLARLPTDRPLHLELLFDRVVTERGPLAAAARRSGNGSHGSGGGVGGSSVGGVGGGSGSAVAVGSGGSLGGRRGGGSSIGGLSLGVWRRSRPADSRRSIAVGGCSGSAPPEAPWPLVRHAGVLWLALCTPLVQPRLPA